MANNFFFHDVSLTLHKEPERVAEIVTSYRTALNNLSESVGRRIRWPAGARSY